LRVATPASLDGPLAYSPSGKYLAISERTKGEADVFDHHVIHLLDVTSGAIVKTFSGHVDLVTALVFSPDGKYLVSGSNTGWVRGALDKKRNQGLEERNEDPIRIWDIESGALVKELAGHAGSVGSLVFYQSGRYLVSGSQDKTIKIWDVVRGTLVSTLTGHNNLVDSIVVSPDGKYLVSGGNSPDFKVWERRS
jgi:WD40 repeat protein